MNNKFSYVSEFLFRRENRTEIYHSQGVNGKIVLVKTDGKLTPRDNTLFYRLIMPIEAYRQAIIKTIPIQYPQLAGSINRQDLKISSVILTNSDSPNNLMSNILFQTNDGHNIHIELDHTLKITKISISR
jgi:hypothetical protein